MIFEAFQPRTTSETEKVIGSDRSGGTCCPLSRYLVLTGSATLPFVIPTEAKRSGGICSSADVSWKCFSTYQQKCHPACPGLPWDRSEAQWRDLLFLP